MNSRWCLVMAVACFAVAQWLASGPLTGMRAQVVANGDVFGALPPGEFAGTIMLGGFRGLACDLVWMRSQNAQRAGRVYESVAMASAIVRMQPRFEHTWKFLAYEMAYNIAADSEDPETKWEWFLAGVDINIQGIRRNPGSNQLIEHLAQQMFHFKGDSLRTRIANRDWAPTINPLLDAVAPLLPPAQRPAHLPPGSQLGNFQLSELLHDLSLRLCAAQGREPPPIVRAMVVHAIERDGNQRRNRGEHLDALRRYVTALARWDEVLAWAHAPTTDPVQSESRHWHGESAEHNQGRLRRKVQGLAEQLAIDPPLAVRFRERLATSDWSGAQSLLDGPGWRVASVQPRVHWLDE